MEAVKEATHKERILRALSQVPIARTDQIAKLFTNNSKLKRASENLNELEREKLVEYEWVRRGKVWRLTTRGLKSMGISRMKFDHVDHMLAVGDVYFTLQPDKFLLEHKTIFSYGSRDDLEFKPDCIFINNKKVWVCEVQLSPLSDKGWKKKYGIYNMYFEDSAKNGVFRNHKYQEWSTTGAKILPQFLCISNQGNVTGLEVAGRELKVISDIGGLL